MQILAMTANFLRFNVENFIYFLSDNKRQATFYYSMIN